MHTETPNDYVTDLRELENLSEAELAELQQVADKYPFYCSQYYLSLIDWNDPNDPIRRIVIPNQEELDEWGRLDPSDEESYKAVEGLEHKYNSTALLLVSKTCAGICRYCFRKRVFLGSNDDYVTDLSKALDYISSHEEITNVLLTGGDPLMLPTERLEEIISRLREIEHIQIIRIGTRMPVYNPYRIIEDDKLLDVIEKYNEPDKSIYVMTHFVHPRELTDVAVQACHLIQKTGAKMTNQTPLIKGVNDDPLILAELFAKLSFCGIVPYYVFQCRPASGNMVYTVPIEKGYEIFEQAKSKVSGLAKRARFVMSHASGKIEIIGKTAENVFMRYHRAADDNDSGRFIILKSNPQACWFDDYDENYPANMPYRSYGPE